MTSNLSVDKINDMLNSIKTKDKHIQITSKIGQSIEFLDVSIENRDGELKTFVFHKSMAEPYILPYQSDHPRHIHKNMPYVGLLRAARLCSDVKDFDAERLNIEMILLLNGYPPNFISHHIKNFFIKFNSMSVRTELDATMYQQLHHQLLYKPTRREKELQDMDDGTGKILRTRQRHEPKNQIIIHHTFESGPMLNFKEKYRRLWNQSYVSTGSRIGKPRLIIGTSNNPCLQSLFVSKKPPREMLTKMEPTIKIPTKNNNH
jgi:hypothetical protein